MIRSMTAFATREQNTPWGRLTWEIRSLNSRYLEVIPRLPELFRSAEANVRETVGRKMKRGKVDCVLKFRADDAARGRAARVDPAVAETLGELEAQLQQHFPEAGALSMDAIVSWPGLIAEPDLESEPLISAALSLLEDTLGDLLAMREREGARLAELITSRIDGVNEQAAVVRELLPELRKQTRDRLDKRIGDLQATVDAERLEQELAVLLQKQDIDEELDRLITHTAEVSRVLGSGKPVGRRLDFLMQELNREANTLGSKATDPRTTNASVELKVLIEQMREQIQNIE